MIKINISVGELFDRLSILHIKRIMIDDFIKRQKIEGEIDELEIMSSFYTTDQKYSKEVKEQFGLLLQVNRNLWTVEEDLRRFEEMQKFDDDFVQKARSVYRLNDRRYILKKNINELCGSEDIEVKQHL
jgi:hypothetical protein